MFWDCKEVLMPEFMGPGTTITLDVYCETLRKSIKNKEQQIVHNGQTEVNL